MKKCLLITLLALSVLYSHNGIYSMSESSSHKREKNDPTREGQPPAATQIKSDETIECNICFERFKISSKNDAIFTGILISNAAADIEKIYTIYTMPCCASHLVCNTCLETLKQHCQECPFCRHPIDFEKVRNPETSAIIKQITETTNKQQADARRKEEIEKFLSGGHLNAYLNIPGDTVIDADVWIYPHGNGIGIGVCTSLNLPILHFILLTNLYPDKLFEIVKYLVEKRNANISEKALIITGGQTLPHNHAPNPFSYKTLSELSHDSQLSTFFQQATKWLTPLEVARLTRKDKIVEYLTSIEEAQQKFESIVKAKAKLKAAQAAVKEADDELNAAQGRFAEERRIDEEKRSAEEKNRSFWKKIWDKINPFK